MLSKNTKSTIIKKFATKEGDTGSPEVQVAILTKEISDLTNHLRSNKKDVASRRGLLKKVTRRKRLMTYLSKTNPDRHVDLVKSLKVA